LRCDLTDERSTAAAFEQIQAEAHGLDVLINAAGLWAAASPGHVAAADIDSMIAINLKTAVFSNQAAHQLMRATGGRIINFGSIEGITGNPRSAAYAAAKAGVHAWSRSAALAWAKDGVTVNVVSPVVDTTNAQRLRDHLSDDGASELASRMKALIPLGRR
jgi:3-oxoacyl-[acyl-carrier protein] reductase